MRRPNIKKGLTAFVLVEFLASVALVGITTAVFYKQVTSDPVFVYVGELIAP
jgi:hypothetical protein